jgi:hypothetical protein
MDATGIDIAVKEEKVSQPKIEISGLKSFLKMLKEIKPIS